MLCPHRCRSEAPEHYPQALTGRLAHASDLLEARIVRGVDAAPALWLSRTQTETTPAVVVKRINGAEAPTAA